MASPGSGSDVSSVWIAVQSIGGRTVWSSSVPTDLTVLQVKQKIYEDLQANKPFQQELVLDSVKLQDHQTLQELLTDIEGPEGKSFTFNLVVLPIDPQWSPQLLRAAGDGSLEMTRSCLHKGADVESTDAYGNTALCLAASNGQTSIVTLLYDARADLNQASADGCTPLHHATYYGCHAIVEFLCEKRVDLQRRNRNGATPLMHAAQQNDLHSVQHLGSLLDDPLAINAKRGDGATALNLAAALGHVEVVESLCDLRADPNACANHMVTPLLLAAREGHLAVVQLLVEHRAELECQAATGATALSIASRMGHSEVVHGLLQAKAEIGQALSVAAQAGHLPIVELLCEHHCDPNVAGRHGKVALDLALQQRHLPIFSLLASYGAMATEDTKDMDLLQSCARGHVESISLLCDAKADVNISDQDGMTPLSYCAQEGLLGPAQRLLHARAYPDGLDGLSGRRHVDGATALCLAVHEGHKELVSLLLQADADENCCMGDGITPLHLACREGHEEVVQLLLEHRADVHRPMANGLTPLGACALCNQVAVAELLVEHGADSFEPSGESARRFGHEEKQHRMRSGAHSIRSPG
ncbi:unnamed protein product [Durusdinium trenchii]|uniref:Ubiquitin-like domain-containing protein n=1 Tax=Durusdinium trenchii TaxID=1381693 RepID=A0ABP0LRG3_9DINO